MKSDEMSTPRSYSWQFGSSPLKTSIGSEDVQTSMTSFPFSQDARADSVLPLDHSKPERRSCVWIDLIEPVLFLPDLDPIDAGYNSTALRGTLHLYLSKPTKVRRVSMSFDGTSVSAWPDCNVYVTAAPIDGLTSLQ